MYVFPQSGTSASIYLPVVDSTGASVTGLLFNSAGASAHYLRPRGSPTAITLATLANAQAAYSSGGFVEVDATNFPGLYRLDLPDTALVSGENFVIVQIDFTASAPTFVLVLLDPMPSLLTGKVVTDAGNTASTFHTDLTETSTDAFKSAFLLWRTGSQAGEVQKVSAYNGSTKFITVGTAYSAAPSANDEFVLVNR